MLLLLLLLLLLLPLLLSLVVDWPARGLNTTSRGSFLFVRR